MEKEISTGKNLGVEKSGIKYGLITTVLLIAYFVVMTLAGLQYQVEFRYVNYLILAIVLVVGLRSLKNDARPFTYYRGISLGLVTTLVTALAFTFFIVMYMVFIDDQLIEAVQQGSIVGSVSPVMITVLTFIELMSGGLILAFILMQIFKPKIDSHKTS